MSRVFVKEKAESAPPPERMVEAGANLVTGWRRSRDTLRASVTHPTIVMARPARVARIDFIGVRSTPGGPPSECASARAKESLTNADAFLLGGVPARAGIKPGHDNWECGVA
jgi:hypothetical protein